jgi:hypothetical protein
MGGEHSLPPIAFSGQFIERQHQPLQQQPWPRLRVSDRGWIVSLLTKFRELSDPEKTALVVRGKAMVRMTRT